MLSTTIALAEDHRNQLLEEARRHRLAQMATGPCPRRRGEPTGGDRADPTGSRRSPVTATLVGLALIGLSAGAFLFSPKGTHGTGRAVLAADRKPAEVTTASLVYEPGHSSGWHVHPGVHSVVVLTGTLTVLDDDCRRQEYGPGETYVGGREPHLARNDGAETVALAVTYVADPSARTPGSPVAPPAGCPSE